MAKKSIMSSLGLKKSPVVRRVEYDLPEVFDDPSDWEQVIKLLFQENIKDGTLMEIGYINLDEAFLKSKIKDVIEIREAIPEIKDPFKGRKAYLAQIELVDGYLRDRNEDQKYEGMETAMMYVVTFKNMDNPPLDLQKQINDEIKKKKRPLKAEEKNTIIDAYLDDPEKFLPTLPVYIKATVEIFDVMYGASMQIVENTVNEKGDKMYDTSWKSFRISNNDLVVVLVGGSIYGKKGKSKSIWVDQVVYFMGEEDGEE